jgi:hypothetical protein
VYICEHCVRACARVCVSPPLIIARRRPEDRPGGVTTRSARRRLGVKAAGRCEAAVPTASGLRRGRLGRRPPVQPGPAPGAAGRRKALQSPPTALYSVANSDAGRRRRGGLYRASRRPGAGPGMEWPVSTRAVPRRPGLCHCRAGLAEAPSRPSRESLKTPSRAESLKTPSRESLINISNVCYMGKYIVAEWSRGSAMVLLAGV